jgi:CheY-like chemotaxis protein
MTRPRCLHPRSAIRLYKSLHVLAEEKSVTLNASVLLVDDDAPVASALSDVLSLLGCSVTWKGSRPDAAAALSQPNDFDVVLLDLQLGTERGEQLIEDARKCDVALPPVVILSAQPETELAAAAKSVDAVGVLRKPCTLAGVVQAIERAKE